MWRRAMAGILVAWSAFAVAAADRPRDPNTPLPNVDPNGEKEIGSNLRQRQVTAVDRDKLYSVREGHAMAMCVVNKHRASVKAFLETTDPTMLIKAHRAMTTNLECYSLAGMSGFAYEQSINFPRDIERGMLAEEMLGSKAPYAALPALPPQTDYPVPLVKVSGRAPAVEEMAECVAARDPAGVVALLQTVPESDHEMAAVGALSPMLGECLVTNAKLTANRQSLRAALAEALYHRVNAPPAAVAGAGR